LQWRGMMAKTKKIKEALQSTLKGGDAMQRALRKKKSMEKVEEYVNKNKKKRHMPKIGK